MFILSFGVGVEGGCVTVVISFSFLFWFFFVSFFFLVS